MTVINEADALYLGGLAVDAVYVGATQVWPPVAWTPTNIPGLTAWVDASQDTGTFTDGELIGTYVEHSGAGRVFNAQHGPSGPVFHTGGGKPYLEFYSIGDGSGGLFSADLWNPGTTGLTFVMVNKITGGSYPMHMVWGPDADGFEMRHDGSSLQIVTMYSTYGIYFSHGTGDGGVTVIHALRVRPGAGTDAWVNSVKVTGAAVSAMPNIPQTLWIGRRQGGYPLFGPVHEALVFAGPISDADQALLWAYLTAKWGL